MTNSSADFYSRKMLAAEIDSLARQEKSSCQWPWNVAKLGSSLDAHHHCHVFLSGETTIGYSVMLCTGESAELLNLVVFKNYQRQGYGRQIIKWLEKYWLERSISSIWLEVRESNKPARSLYDESGFALQGIRKNYYPCGSGAHESAVLMGKMIATQ